MSVDACMDAPGRNDAGVRSLSRAFATRLIASFSRVGEGELTRARDALLDYSASALAGLHDPVVIKAIAIANAATDEATIMGTALRASRGQAAFVNAVMGHAIDYDDVHRSARGHPSTILFPVLLAFAESESKSLTQVLGAYVSALEYMTRLGLALGPDHYDRGFHSTSVLGAPAAAAGGCLLLGLDENTTHHAIGLAATRASGIRAQFGTDVKPLHAGFAAQAAMEAVLLARSGISGARDYLGGDGGFLSAYGGHVDRADVELANWGRPWQIVDPGLIFKRYPCCTGNHLALDCLLVLLEQHAFSTAEIEAIIVTFPPGGDAPLLFTRPETGVEGRFSVEYAFAVALAYRNVPPQVFQDGPVAPELTRLMALTRRQHDLAAPPASNNLTSRFARVELRLRNGARFQAEARGRPRGASNLSQKFRDAGGTRESERLIIAGSTVAHLAALLRSMAQDGRITSNAGVGSEDQQDR